MPPLTAESFITELIGDQEIKDHLSLWELEQRAAHLAFSLVGVVGRPIPEGYYGAIQSEVAEYTSISGLHMAWLEGRSENGLSECRLLTCRQDSYGRRPADDEITEHVGFTNSANLQRISTYRKRYQTFSQHQRNFFLRDVIDTLSLIKESPIKGHYFI